MTCHHNKTAPLTTHEVITKLFADGRTDLAAMHRLGQCVRATKCNRICERLVKGVGKADVRCVNPETNTMVMLYEAIIRPNWHCPKGLF